MVKTILLRQHIGAPATPVVKVGDSVKRGSLLAAPEKLGANVHSSVDGVVKEITDDNVKELTYQPNGSVYRSFRCL